MPNVCIVWACKNVEMKLNQSQIGSIISHWRWSSGCNCCVCPETILNDSEYLHYCTNTEALEFIFTQKVFL